MFMSSNPMRSFTCQEIAKLASPYIPSILGMSTRKDWRALCQCFKKNLPCVRIKPERVKELSRNCKVVVPSSTNPNVDCNRLIP
ncbi:hypothetical protein ACJRO7_003255 [Eucalyptus globulus]|uniref:Uncharacterized protein n=1 Tax=Eucalyptus globulus TaxID=34317 RepID=A0ABD3IVS9_EUCGL